ncbi:MAG TPA: MotA/TolQ/ExbB proton channel family protein [Gemmatales bacterium]|nr:MotA/TolQ/ExbB proton channel family protein [Gemmatales bacterium]
MSVRRAFRLSPEGPLLILAVAAVAAVSLPLWQVAPTTPTASVWFGTERLTRLLLGPEQLLCYGCFIWAGLILLVRRRESVRQERALGLDLLPDDPTWRILPADAPMMQRKIERLAEPYGPLVLVDWLSAALRLFGRNRSVMEIDAHVNTLADLEMGRLAASMGRVHYLAWALPALGFVGTARGIAMALSVAPAIGTDANAAFLDLITRSLAVTFDTTFIALVLSLVLMFFITSQQRMEEILLLDLQQHVSSVVHEQFHVPRDRAHSTHPGEA